MAVATTLDDLQDKGLISIVPKPTANAVLARKVVDFKTGFDYLSIPNPDKLDKSLLAVIPSRHWVPSSFGSRIVTRKPERD
jgi:hypothetical protein